MTAAGIVPELEEFGRERVRRGLSGAGLRALDMEFDVRDAPGERYPVGVVRPALRELTMLVRVTLPRAEPVRVVFFNKSDTTNWSLAWHQDRVVAVKARCDVPGFANWTRKDGVWHAEPPTELLQQMIFARVHLDDATETNGCLKLALGTHTFGRIAADDMQGVVQRAVVEDCVAERGDVLLAKALIVHRSASSQTGARRRAIRVDYCAESLPAPLEWAD